MPNVSPQSHVRHHSPKSQMGDLPRRRAAQPAQVPRSSEANLRFQPAVSPSPMKASRRHHRSGDLGHQRESETDPFGDGERDTDDGCTLDCTGLGCDTGAACCKGGADDIFCLMSSSMACSAARFWAICSCLAASSSTPRRMSSRPDAKDSSFGIGSGAVAATTGDLVVEVDNSQASAGTRATARSRTASPYDCQASVAPTPMNTVMKNRAAARTIRLPIDGRRVATASPAGLEE
jgi:hypothetical protein